MSRRLTRIVCWGAVLSVLGCVPTASAVGAGAAKAVTVRVKIYAHPFTVAEPGKITFTPDHVKTGSVVTFRITNEDPSIFHDFEIDGHQTRNMGPHGGQAVIRNLRFTTPGRYTGSVPNDNHSGIGGFFTVG